jgi:uncharacterized damage-inducible protein DinB
MLKSQITNLPEYFDRYISYVPELHVLTALENYGIEYLLKEKESFRELGHMVYSPGKWTLRDILQHLIDTERIFAYRALRFARNDKTTLPGFDENLFADNAHASGRKLDSLLEEFDLVRQSTIALYKSFNEDTLLQEGFVYKSDISVLALGFTMVGHVIHHVGVIRERYYPLIRL